MKVYDIICETNDLNEKPVGGFTQGLRKLGAKAAAKIGMKGTAGKMATKADIGAEANRIRQELDQMLAGAGEKELQLQDFINFLQNAGFEKNRVIKTVRKYAPKTKSNKTATDKPDTLTASIENNYVTESIDIKIADKVILDLVRQGFKKQAGGKQAKSKYATTGKTGSTPNPEVDNAIELLKKQGYKITK